MNAHGSADRIEKLVELSYCNPFANERRRLERELLGSARTAVWSVGQANEESVALRALAEQLLRDMPRAERTRRTEMYEQLVFYVLYYRHTDAIEELIRGRLTRPGKIFQTLRQEVQEYRLNVNPAELFAVFFQIRRAFDGIYSAIVGSTDMAGQLRAAIWETIFTHDMRRYQKSLVHRRFDFPTIIMGPSGTGKELVAQAIAMGRHIPYDERRGDFAEPFAELLLPLNLSALSPTLIESELFGHRRGAFTGAIEDRIGWLEKCSERGVVFVDEIGELDMSLQVKLLRVLQDRQFQRIGETRSRTFKGKIIAATNRSLEHEIEAGRFRADLYYRLCADIIRTPTLSELTEGNRDELRQMVRFISTRLLGEESERDRLVEQVMTTIRRDVGGSYPWPGNFRELEQCVHRVLIRGGYKPATTSAATRPLAAQIENVDLTADELLDRYCRIAYERCGSYLAASKKLKLDRRTVLARVERSKTALSTAGD